MVRRPKYERDANPRRHRVNVMLSDKEKTALSELAARWQVGEPEVVRRLIKMIQG